AGPAGSISFVARTGGTPRALAAAQPFPIGVGVDSNSIYWVNQANDETPSGSVWKMNLDGSNQVQLAGGQVGPAILVLDQNNVYWSAGGNSNNTNDAGPLPGGIYMCPKTGCPGTGPISLAGPQQKPAGLAVFGQTIYWAAKDVAGATNLFKCT